MREHGGRAGSRGRSPHRKWKLTHYPNFAPGSGVCQNMKAVRNLPNATRGFPNAIWHLPNGFWGFPIGVWETLFWLWENPELRLLAGNERLRPKPRENRQIGLRGRSPARFSPAFCAKTQGSRQDDRIYRMLLTHPVHPVEKAHGRRQQHLEIFAPTCCAAVGGEGGQKSLIEIRQSAFLTAW